MPSEVINVVPTLTILCKIRETSFTPPPLKPKTGFPWCGPKKFYTITIYPVWTMSGRTRDGRAGDRRTELGKTSVIKDAPPLKSLSSKSTNQLTHDDIP